MEVEEHEDPFAAVSSVWEWGAQSPSAAPRLAVHSSAAAVRSKGGGRGLVETEDKWSEASPVSMQVPGGETVGAGHGAVHCSPNCVEGK